MTHLDIVNKIIGRIEPAGDASRDDEYFANLIAMCDLTNRLIMQIDNVAYKYKDSYEHSVKRAADYAADALTNTFGIKE